MHDQVQRLMLHVAKLSKPAMANDSGSFYEGFFEEKSLDDAAYDLRFRLRRRVVQEAVVALPLRQDQIGRRARVVDIGCGVGDVLKSLPDNFVRLGLSYSSNDLALARRNCGDKISFLKGSAFELPLRDSSADVVIMLEVLEHLQDESRALNEIARVLRPGAFLVISVPNAHYFPDYFRLIGHYRHYTRASLTRTLEQSGFRVVRHLEQFPRTEKLHYYPYIALVGLHRALNKCGISQKSMYQRPILGRSYLGLAGVIERRARSRSSDRLAADERSTFVVAEKFGS